MACTGDVDRFDILAREHLRDPMPSGAKRGFYSWTASAAVGGQKNKLAIRHMIGPCSDLT
jgi:hypothetical protein